jgi:hypothetical protein
MAKVLDTFHFLVVPHKYRGTTEYARVREELVRAAECGELTTYGKLAEIMGLPARGNHMSRETGHLLGEISEDEVQAGRPMLSALVVTVAGKPGSGFINLAKDLGKFSGGTVDEVRFWRQECQAVYQSWRRPAQDAASAERPRE